MNNSDKFFLPDISARIRAKMDEKGWTRTKLAKETDISYRLLFDVDHGKVQGKMSTYGKIAIALGEYWRGSVTNAGVWADPESGDQIRLFRSIKK